MKDDPSLPLPVVAEPTVRETVWAADSGDTVDMIGEELSKDRDVQIGDDGSVHAVDPEGYGIGFAVTGRVDLPPAVRAVPVHALADFRDQVLLHVLFFSMFLFPIIFGFL